jgi:hypothetical protein
LHPCTYSLFFTEIICSSVALPVYPILILMKKAFVLLLLAGIVCSCETGRMETPKAMQAVESLVREIDRENYSAAASYYTFDFNQSEPEEVRVKKFSKLKAVMGAVKSMTVTDSLNEATMGEEARVVLTYKISRERVNSVETFIVKRDEGGYRIASHSIRSEGL